MIVYHHKERLKVARIVRSIAIKLVARAREQCQDETRRWRKRAAEKMEKKRNLESLRVHCFDTACQIPISNQV